MIAPALPHDEEERLAALRALNILDTAPEERFDRITRTAARVFDVPVAYVAMVDASRQWFKSTCGLDITETSREVSFCGHAILEERALVIPDTHADPRFADNPLVEGPPPVRFYAGRPLRARGHKVGTLCLTAPHAREFSDAERELLDDLAELVERELQLAETMALQRRLVEARGLAHELLDIVIPLGVSLSANRDWSQLLETIVGQAMRLGSADAGLLLLRDGAGRLRRELLRVNSLEETVWLREELDVAEACPEGDCDCLLVWQAARSGESVNVTTESAGRAGLADVMSLVETHGYHARSVLIQPLVGPDEAVVGVLQLLTSDEPIAGASGFDEARARAVQALSALAAAALEGYARERRLRQRIRSLELSIDEAKRDRQVESITESQFFHDLLDRATQMKR